MVKLRLKRTGRRNYATYRVIAVDSRKKRDSKSIEELGHYLPHSKEFKVNEERVKYWLSVGAQPSETVAKHLARAGIISDKDLDKKTFNSEPGRKSQERKEAAQAKADEAKAAAAAAKAEAEKPAEAATEDKAEESEAATTDEAAVETDEAKE